MPVFLFPWAMALLSCTLAGTYTPELGSSYRAWDPEDSGEWVEAGAFVDPGGDGADGGGDGGLPAETTVTAVPSGGTYPCADGDPLQPASLSIENALGYEIEVLFVGDDCALGSAGTLPMGATLPLIVSAGASLIVRELSTGVVMYSIVAGTSGGAVRLP